MKRRYCVAVAVLLSLAAQGCGGSGLDRQNLYGRVTYKGEPVPFGSIAFRPDRSKGGKGPAGFAQIVEGEYSTKSSGKGSVTGPVIVMIEGQVANKPLSPALFPTYKTSIDVTPDTDELDFDVPETDPNEAASSKRRGRSR